MDFLDLHLSGLSETEKILLQNRFAFIVRAMEQDHLFIAIDPCVSFERPPQRLLEASASAFST